MSNDSSPVDLQGELIRFWGVRGSIPAPGPSTVRYGGNTTCVEFRINGEIIVIDAGSGIRSLGGALLKESAGKPIELTLLNTHTHWDHIQGFPFFAPAFIKGNRIRVIGGNSQPDALKAVFEKQMDGTRCFPVPFAVLGAAIDFQHIENETDYRFQIGSVNVEACPTSHPGGCLAYAFETNHGRVVFLSDHETGAADEPRILEFIKGARLLIADAQYDAAEITSRRGWGHGSTDEVVDLAIKGKVQELYLFHHDPTHDDDRLDAMLGHARALANNAGVEMVIQSATEGTDIRL